MNPAESSPPASSPEALDGLARGLHHVAIAVESIAAARGVWESALGFAASEVEHVADQRVNVLVLTAGGTRVELVEPAHEDSPIKGFLERRGSGLHHLAWRVDSCSDAIEKLLARGVRMIDEAPRPGSHGTTIAFVHPKATGGVLTELVEDPTDSTPH